MKSLVLILVLLLFGCNVQAQSIRITRPGGHVVTRQFRDRSLYFHPNGYNNLRRTSNYNRLIRNHVKLAIQIQRDLTDTNKILYRFRNGTILRLSPWGKAYVDYTPVWGTLGMESYYRGILKEGIR